MCSQILSSCRRVAVFSDIHSNYDALKVCVEDAIAAGAEGFIFLGDYVSGLAEPAETMDLVYGLQERFPTLCIRGNRERYMLEQQKGRENFVPGSHTGSLLFTYRRLRPRDLRFFEALPHHTWAKIGGMDFELAHATQSSDRYYYEKGDAVIQSVFQSMQSEYLITGHSHKQYIAHDRGKTIFNPGSVGFPYGGAAARYGLLEISDGSVFHQFRCVPYDLRSVIHKQFESGLVETGMCWAIADLYSVLTGGEYTKQLLSRIYGRPDSETALRDEALWRQHAGELGLFFTEKEVLEFLSSPQGA